MACQAKALFIISISKQHCHLTRGDSTPIPHGSHLGNRQCKVNPQTVWRWHQQSCWMRGLPLPSLPSPPLLSRVVALRERVDDGGRRHDWGKEEQQWSSSWIKHRAGFPLACDIKFYLHVSRPDMLLYVLLLPKHMVCCLETLHTNKLIFMHSWQACGLGGDNVSLWFSGDPPRFSFEYWPFENGRELQ